MSKQTVQSVTTPKVPTAITIGVYCVRRKEYVQMTLEQSVRDVMKNHDYVSYCVSKESYDLNKKIVDDVMKRCQYKPALNANGRFNASNGGYEFVFAGEKVLAL